MNKVMLLVVAGLISNVAIAGPSDPLGTGALEVGSVDYMQSGSAADFARVDHTDPLGTGALEVKDDSWKGDASRSVSQPEIGDSEAVDFFGIYETSDVL